MKSDKLTTDLNEMRDGDYVTEWLICGPFVIRTGTGFEQEYIHERERILNVDYLAEDGGEASIEPFENLTHRNLGLGKKELRWQRYSGRSISFVDLTGAVLYATIQRNVVWYAVAYVECDSTAFVHLDFQHSGARLWVNHQQVLSQPVGRAKGMALAFAGVVVKLKQGTNIILAKIRPGYIADGIDFQLHGLRVFKVIQIPDFPIGLTKVSPTPFFLGTLDKPRQMVEMTVFNTTDSMVEDVTVVLSWFHSTIDDKATIDKLGPRESCVVRLGVPTPKSTKGQQAEMVITATVGNSRQQLTTIRFTVGEVPTEDGHCFVETGFHFDLTYHEEQRVYAMGAFDILRQYMQQFRRDPNFKAKLSEVDYLKPYFDTYPADRQLLRQMFREGRAEPDVMYNQPNEMSVTGEALVRNFVYGQLFHHNVMGRKCYVYSPGDVFGHPAQISQIAKKSGCTAIAWGKYILGFPPLFWHISPDRSRLIHQRGYGTRRELQTMGLASFHGTVDHTPPTEWIKKVTPKISFSVPSEYFKAVYNEIRTHSSAIPTTTRDMSLYHAGTALSRVNLKIANRLGENLLLNAEKFATIANLLGARYPDKTMDKAWRQLLCGHHHDSITGTHNEISYLDLMSSYREILDLGAQVLNRALSYIGEAINTNRKQKSLSFAVFNPLAWERTEVCIANLDFGEDGIEGFRVKDHKHNLIKSQLLAVERNSADDIISAKIAFVAETVPSLGYKTYFVEACESTPQEAAQSDGLTIENEFYRITVDPESGGGLTSIYDKQVQREVLDLSEGHTGNEIAVLQEAPNREEPPHEFYTTGLRMFSKDQPAKVQLETGPVLSKIIVRGEMQEVCDRHQEIVLYENVKRIDFKTVILDYQRENDLFAITFPTNVAGAIPVFDDRFAAITRHESQNYLDFRTHQEYMFSNCGVYSADKWLDYSSSVKIEFRDNSENYTASCALGMVGIITPNAETMRCLGDNLQESLIIRGVTCTPWLDENELRIGSKPQDMNDDLLYCTHRISLGINGNNKYTEKLLATIPSEEVGAFRDRVLAKGAALLLLMDTTLPEAWEPIAVLIVEATNEDELRKCVSRICDDIESNAIIKLDESANLTGNKNDVDDYGVAIINVGNIANSVEKKGVLTLLLFHTAQWYGGTDNFPEGYLVPEQKDHVFKYSLYPHSGNWRSAKTYQVGMNVNNPLMARQLRPHVGFLPEQLSFIEVEPDNLILTTMKPAGNPVAAFEGRNESQARNGVTIRIHDICGVKQQASIGFFRQLQKAWTANLLEQKQQDDLITDGKLVIDINPNSIETFGFIPESLPKQLVQELLGPEKEPVQPVYVRSWEHDAESIPMGYETVVATINREVRQSEDGKTLSLKVGIINDYADMSVSGQVDVIVPTDWSVRPSLLKYEVAPLREQVFPVIVTLPKPNISGQIKVRLEHQGQIFQDVLEVGEAVDLKFEVQRRDGEIQVVLTNPTEEVVDGEVTLVSPVETWPVKHVGDYSLMEISPRTQGFNLQPQERRIMIFTEIRQGPSLIPEKRFYWAVVKLMYNGRIYLKRCGVSSESRIWRRHKMINQINHSNAALKTQLYNS